MNVRINSTRQFVGALGAWGLFCIANGARKAHKAHSIHTRGDLDRQEALVRCSNWEFRKQRLKNLQRSQAYVYSALNSVDAGLSIANEPKQLLNKEAI